MGKKFNLITGLLFGAGLMYVLDPERGKRRRAVARDKARHFMRKTEEAIGRTGRDVRNRVYGSVASLGRAFTASEVDPEILVERVRARMGHVVTHPGSIDVTAEGGRIMLSGPVLAGEVDRLIKVVSRVPGVVAVENNLEVHEEPGNVPGLQGGPQPPVLH